VCLRDVEPIDELDGENQERSSVPPDPTGGDSRDPEASVDRCHILEADRRHALVAATEGAGVRDRIAVGLLPSLEDP